MVFLRVSVCLLLFGVLAGHGQAGILRLAPSEQDVDAGASFSLKLFFDEVNGDVSAAGGLVSAGARLLVESSVASSIIVDQVTLNPGFDVRIVYPTDQPFPIPAPPDYSNLVGFFQFSVISPPVLDPSGSILLAEFQLRTSASPGTSIEFLPSTLGTPPPFIGLVGADMTDFDSTAQSETAIVNVTGVIPEPGSMLIWAGLVGAPLLVRRRRCKLVAKA